MSDETELPLRNETRHGPTRSGVSRLSGAFVIAISKVRPDASQPRRTFDEDELRNLAASIAERGIRQPIRVFHEAKDDSYRIVSGERRYRAALQLGLTEIPCIVDKPPAGDPVPNRATVLVDQIVENWQREDLDPYELSDALAELRDKHGLTQEAICRRTGKDKSEVSRIMQMQRVVPEIRTKIQSDPARRYSRRHIVALAQLSVGEQQGMATRILSEGLTAEQTEREVSGVLRRRSGRNRRGATYAVRNYSVGSTRIRLTFRKAVVTRQDIIDALLEARRLAEAEAGE